MGKLRAILFAAVLASGIIGGTSAAYASEWIYFHSDRGSDDSNRFQIWRIRPDGSELEQVTFGPYRDIFPQTSPDGTKLAFSRAENAARPCQSIWVKDLISGDEIRVTRDLADDPSVPFSSDTPSFSPDGNELIFSRNRPFSNCIDGPQGTGRLWVVDISDLANPGSDPLEPYPIGLFPGSDIEKTHPSWCADGIKILYQHPGGNSFTIYKMTPLGVGETQVIPQTGVDALPRCSPDGAQVAWPSFRGGAWDIFIADLVEPFPRPASAQFQVTPLSGFQVPSWSPGGDSLAMHLPTSSGADLYLIDVDGDNLQCLVGTAAECLLDDELAGSDAWAWWAKAPLIEVAIDIKPGSDPNSINLDSTGVVPVAIFSSETFDAPNDLDAGTIILAGARVKTVGNGDRLLCHDEFVNEDELLDLVCQVEITQFLIEEGDSVAVLEGETFDGDPVRGEDSIRIVP